MFCRRRYLPCPRSASARELALCSCGKGNVHHGSAKPRSFVRTWHPDLQPHWHNTSRQISHGPGQLSYHHRLTLPPFWMQRSLSSLSSSARNQFQRQSRHEENCGGTGCLSLTIWKVIASISREQ